MSELDVRFGAAASTRGLAAPLNQRAVYTSNSISCCWRLLAVVLLVVLPIVWWVIPDTRNIALDEE